jgi:ABC-type transporter Mla subunit MlaD
MVLLFVLLALVLVVAVVLAIFNYSRRTAAGGQNTVIVERPANDQNTTVVEND